MSRQIVATFLSRVSVPDSGSPLVTFAMEGDGTHSLQRSYPVLDDRPALRSLFVDVRRR